jgi:hypothetical protein
MLADIVAIVEDSVERRRAYGILSSGLNLSHILSFYHTPRSPVHEALVSRYREVGDHPV